MKDEYIDSIIIYLNKFLKEYECFELKKVNKGQIDKQIHYDIKNIDNLFSISAIVDKKTIIYISKVCKFSLKEYSSSLHIPDEFMKLKPWRNKKTLSQMKDYMKSSDSILMFEKKVWEWLENGFLFEIKENINRNTIAYNTYYIPGLTFINYCNRINDQLNENKTKIINIYRSLLLNLENRWMHSSFEQIRQIALNELENCKYDFKKVDFQYSLLVTAAQSEYFDWREIGCNSFLFKDSHTPSKIFGKSYEEYLIKLLLPSSIEDIGLTTVTGSYTIYFTGCCNMVFSFGNRNYWKNNVVSSVTDEELSFLEKIESIQVKLVFLVENRAVLRKIAKHLNIKNRQAIAIIAFDGQVRSAQFKFISKWKDAGIKQVVIWADFDRYALYMLEKLKTLGFESIDTIVSDENGVQKLYYPEAIERISSISDHKILIEQEYWLKEMVKLEKILESYVG